MKTIIENLIQTKEELIQHYTKIKSETSEYYDGYYCGTISELRESISELKMILQMIEFEQSARV